MMSTAPEKERNKDTVTLAPLADKRISVTMTPKEGLQFVQRLACDDEFRSRFEKNPQEVLAENHIILPPDMIPATAVLPPKSALQDVLTNISLREQFGPIAIGPFIAFIAFVSFIAFIRK